MLYILPPPRATNPPSPWDSILCASNGNGAAERPPWAKRHPPRARLRSFNAHRHDDSSTGVPTDDADSTRNPKSLSECYFAGKGTALVLPSTDAQKNGGSSAGTKRNGSSSNGSNIQKHLQSMFYLLRPEETLKMAVKLESVHPTRTRYLVVVSRMGQKAEESCLLGIDCNEKTTVGLVLRVLADTSITLDGDGGFSVTVCGRHHIFKPVSVQAMWSALQTLHKVSSKAREENYFQGGLTHSWVNYYEQRIESDRSCLNEWHTMDNLESRRPPSPDSVRTKPRERDETERVIRSTLKEIMMSVDLDEVTSKYIRNRLEEDFDMDLTEYKSFIDEEMLTIMGQLDAPTEIFEHVYLGSEWNASNYEELMRNGVGHILNVTREIDNFFPGTFDYLNVRVYDDEKTDLLKHWDNTFKYISKAKREGSKVLVHCKMGVSRSASVVIAYAMKAYNWDFKTALKHVKEKRSCIKPNSSFIAQLETYQGILDAMKNKEKLQRSKSETNLKSPLKNERIIVGSEPTPIVQTLIYNNHLQTTMSGQDLRHLGSRPKSWSPDTTTTTKLTDNAQPVFLSLENLNQKSPSKESLRHKCLEKAMINSSTLNRNVLLPCDNGESYSVSPNQIRHLPGHYHEIDTVASVKERINELEAQARPEKSKLVLNLNTQFVNVQDVEFKTNEELRELGVRREDLEMDADGVISEEKAVAVQTKEKKPMLRAVLVKKEIWDPGESVNQEKANSQKLATANVQICDSSSVSNEPCAPGSEEVPKDVFSNQLDQVFDHEEKKQHLSTPDLSSVNINIATEEMVRDCPSRQSSWSSYDSAVVLGEPRERDLPSRHSSFGSGDTRTLPSRNSSWGSYDIRPVQEGEDISYQYRTVKKSKQPSKSKSTSTSSETLTSDYPPSIVSTNEGSVEAFNVALLQTNLSVNTFPSAISPEIDIVTNKEGSSIQNNSRLSVSAPESSSMELVSHDCPLSRSLSNVSSYGKLSRDISPNIINTAQCLSVKEHKTLLEKKQKDAALARKSFVAEELEEQKAGIVRNLKKEFEAKKNKGSSLPSSPICQHAEKSAQQQQQQEVKETTSDDRTLKKLIGKFEPPKYKPEQVTMRPKHVGSKAVSNKNARHSCFEMSTEKGVQKTVIPLFGKNLERKSEHDFRRPPIVPSVRNAPSATSNSMFNTILANNVIAKAQTKKQQQQYGKTHPLARLRHNNPVYNTM